MASINLSVNGKQFSADVDPAMPLLWALRDVLNLTVRFSMSHAAPKAGASPDRRRR